MGTPTHAPSVSGIDLPHMVVAPPGPNSRRWTERISRAEASGIDTRGGGARPIVWSEALGANVVDVDGNRYLDLTSGFGVAALGHRAAAIEAAVDRQRQLLVHGLGDLHAHPTRIQLAEALGALVPFQDPRVYFAISGSDAVEVALKSSLLSTGRPAILAFEGGYHGTTLGALAATARPAFRQPFLAQLNPWIVRLPFGAAASEIESCLAREGGVGAVLVEPVQGRGGVILPPTGWLAELRVLTARHGARLIFDELLTGGGRTGPFFAGPGEGVLPDLLCCGKALSGGYPLAAVIGHGEVLDHWPADGEAIHTATFLAHPVACAASLAALEALRAPKLTAHRVDRSQQFRESLEALVSGSGRSLRVRGRGLLWGLDLLEPGAAVLASQRLLERGLLALPSGPRGEVLELLPPFTITARQAACALQLLTDLLAFPGAID